MGRGHPRRGEHSSEVGRDSNSQHSQGVHNRGSTFDKSRRPEGIGRTLNEMETYVELAKQKKIAEMKKRNKEFLKQNLD